MEEFKNPQETFIGENQKLMNRLKEELGFSEEKLGFSERPQSMLLSNLNQDVDRLILQRGQKSGKLFLMAGGWEETQLSILVLGEFEIDEDENQIFAKISKCVDCLRSLDTRKK